MQGTPAQATPAQGASPQPTPAQGTPRVPGPRDGRSGAGRPGAGRPGVGRPGDGRPDAAHGFTPYGDDAPEGAAARPAPRPEGSVPSGPTVTGTGPLGSPVTPQGRVPAPRQEYVDAFDQVPGGQRPGGPQDEDDDVFAAGAPGRAPAHPVGARPGPPVASGPATDGAHGTPDDDEGVVEIGAEGHRSGTGKKGAKGRTFTGVAAAAVTTVLAVVVAGQVAEQQQDDGKPQALGEGDRAADAAGASRSQARPTQQAAPASYDQKMAQVFPLDEKLTASGRFKPAGGDAKEPGHGRVLRYRVDVEEGMGLDGQLFADAVHKTLNDERSWAHGGQRTFRRVGSGHADFVVTLASPGTTAKWCAKSGLDTTEDNVSCDSAATERIMINAYRWAQGAKTYGPDKMHAYRQMLINHEVGHRLGHNHESCGRQGALAPVMMQQTKFLTTDGATCRPNAWPFPDGR
ncbi:DUF3152 domain-containing protein [Streptomyces sp. NPDC018019]|uniref:DUF3152 domain-containing protein n=1 Tax=Streptomyces sp. NPDC018019 TaxID=3365030 RepID=UPI0037B639E3